MQNHDHNLSGDMKVTRHHILPDVAGARVRDVHRTDISITSFQFNNGTRDSKINDEWITLVKSTRQMFDCLTQFCDDLMLNNQSTIAMHGIISDVEIFRGYLLREVSNTARCSDSSVLDTFSLETFLQSYSIPYSCVGREAENNARLHRDKYINVQAQTSLGEFTTNSMQDFNQLNNTDTKCQSSCECNSYLHRLLVEPLNNVGTDSESLFCTSDFDEPAEKYDATVLKYVDDQTEENCGDMHDQCSAQCSHAIDAVSYNPCIDLKNLFLTNIDALSVIHLTLESNVSLLDELKHIESYEPMSAAYYQLPVPLDHITSYYRQPPISCENNQMMQSVYLSTDVCQSTVCQSLDVSNSPLESPCSYMSTKFSVCLHGSQALDAMDSVKSFFLFERWKILSAARSMSHDTNPGNVSMNNNKGRPNQDQLNRVQDYLALQLPKLFVRPHDYSVYTPDVVFENNWYDGTTRVSIWIDGFSTFFVNDTGFIYKHRMDRVMPDEGGQQVKSKTNVIARLRLSTPVTT